MIRRLAALVLAIAGFALAEPAAAQALALPQFGQCQTTAHGERAPISLTRWVTDNPRNTFLASNEAGLVIGKKPKFETYLTRSGPNGPWRLWIVPTNFSDFILSNAELVTLPGSQPPRAFAARTLGDWLIFELDPAELLAANVGKTFVEIGVLDAPTKPGGKRRLRGAGKLDLLRLGGLMAWLPALERRSMGGDCTPSSLTPIEPLDPRAYTRCQAGSGPWADWWQGHVRVVWQRQLHRPGESYMYFDFQLRLSAADAEPLLAEPTDRTNDPLDTKIAARISPDWIDLSKRAGIKVSDQQQLRVRLTGDWGSSEMLLLDLANQWRPPLYAQIVKNRGDLRIEILSPRGQTVQTFIVPAGTFVEARNKMRASLRDLAELLKDPMQNCAPPNSIVVT